MPSDNPAQLSTQLAALFPADARVVAAELLGNAPTEVLTSPELQFINHCAEKRIQDFTAGRACAHRALQELGVAHDFSLLSGTDRAPIWPQGVVGSITHTKGFRAAAVARDRDLRSLGLDCEGASAVDAELWPRICTPSELELLEKLERSDSAAAQRRAALIFAAKEAFYKCQYPLTKQWVGFEDVIIETETLSPEPEPGIFRVVPQKPLDLDSGLIASAPGRFVFREKWVIAGIAVPT